MSTVQPLFSQQDREIIEALVFDSSLLPEYNPVSTCLFWDDELPLDATRGARQVIRELWIARSLLHKGLTFGAHPFNPEACRQMWEQANKEIPGWIGFRRLTLNERDRAYLENEEAVENPFE